MNNSVTSVAVFCGSSDGKDAKYCQLAADFGRLCGQNKITVYYGGAKLGMMNAVAEAALSENTAVIGIIPDFFSGDVVVAQNITEQIWVKSMSERKQKMEQLADAFVILPGSFGTMDELFEVVTDAQLGLHRKPIVILNAFGYYDLLIKQLDVFANEGFLRPFHKELISVAASPEDVFRKLSEFSYSNDLAWLEKHTLHSKR